MKSRRKPKAQRDPQWTEQDVLQVVTNPFLMGLGPFPQVISEQDWRRAAILVIQQEGPEKFIDGLIENLKAAFENFEITTDEEFWGDENIVH